MAKIYVGEEKKFAIELTAPGFSMDDDDFEIEVGTAKGSVKGDKNNTQGDTGIRIFKEDSDSSSSGEGSTWYVIVDTSKIPGTGDLKVIGTAYVPDVNADDGIRKSIAVNTQLGTLANP